MPVLNPSEAREQERREMLEQVRRVDAVADARAALEKTWADYDTVGAGLTSADVRAAVDAGLAPDETVTARKMGLALADYAAGKRGKPSAEQAALSRRRILEGFRHSLLSPEQRAAIERVYSEDD